MCCDMRSECDIVEDKLYKEIMTNRKYDKAILVVGVLSMLWSVAGVVLHG